MRDFGIQQSVNFSTSALDRIAYWVNCRTHGQVWCLIVVATASVMILDLIGQGSGLDVDVFYIVPISLACWVFKLHKGVATTMAIVLVSLLPAVSRDADMGSMALLNGLTRATAFAFLAAIVIGCRQMFDYAQSLATHDYLTGALNKGTFNDRMALMIDLARIGGSLLLLIMLDLDGFKTVNDLHGHDAGDMVLQTFTHQARRELRQNDCFGRVGGDEFAVGMLIASDNEARAVVENLHGRFTSVLAASGYAVTCSMGALIVPPTDNQTYGELMRLADQLMYAAKHSGKNAVQIMTVVPASNAQGADRRSEPNWGVTTNKIVKV